MPRVSVNLPKVVTKFNKFAQVVEICKESKSSAKRRLANQSKGMASIVFLDDIPGDVSEVVAQTQSVI